MDNIKLIQVFVEFWGAVLCSVCALALILIRKEEPKSSSVLSAILGNIVVLLCCDALSIYYMGGYGIRAYYCTRICTFLVFFESLMISFFAVMLLMEVLRDHMIILSSRWHIAAGGGAILGTLDLLINLFSARIYFVDGSNQYHRGSLFFLSLIFPYCIIFIYILLLVLHRRYLGLREKISLWFYALFPLCMSVFQIYHSDLSLTNVAMAVSAMVMMLQRLTEQTFLRREARIQIEQKLHPREESDPAMDERLRRATMGKGDVKHIFIVNPNAGNFFKVEKLRTVIGKLPEQDYFVFTTRGPGDETELIRQIRHYFVGYKLRIYCCGGSGTIRNVMNGIEDLSTVEIGFYPCGMTNDFLKVFGKDQEKFDHIENLIEGSAIPVDYIRTNHGVALNTFSTGMDSNILKGKDRYKSLTVFGQNVPYILAMFRSLLTTRARDYIIETDGRDRSQRSSQIIFGNGGVIGGSMYFTKDADIADGRANFFFSNDHGSVRLLPAAFTLMKKKYNRLPLYGRIGSAQKIRIRRRDNRPLEMDCDGEMVYGYSEWEAEIVHKGMNLIVPKGVMLHE